MTGSIVRLFSTEHSSHIITEELRDALKLFFEGRFFCKVTNVVSQSFGQSSKIFFQIKPCSSLPYPEFYVDSRDCESFAITDEEAFAYQEKIESGLAGTKNKKLSEEVKYDAEEIAKLNETPFSEIDFSNPSDKNNNPYSIIRTGCSVKGVFIQEEFKNTVYANECVSKYSHDRDVFLYIATDWTNHFGYSEEVVKKWICFIKEAGFPLHISYLGIKPIEEHKVKKSGTFSKTFTINNSYHCIHIKGTDCDYFDVFAVCLIKSLYFKDFNNIPGLCLQINEASDLHPWDIIKVVCSYKRNGFMCQVGFKNLLDNGHYVGIYPFGKEYDISLLIDKINKGRVSDNMMLPEVFINRQHFDSLITLISEKKFSNIKYWISEIENNKQIRDEGLKKSRRIKVKHIMAEGSDSFLFSHPLPPDDFGELDEPL